MRDIFKPGDVKTHRFIVEPQHMATFDSGTVHKVCSTFVLAREMEWSGRLFVLEMCESHEEGVGTMLHIDHKSPAFLEEEIEIEAVYSSFENRELICDIEVRVGERIIATGQTGQKILSRQKISQIFTSLER